MRENSGGINFALQLRLAVRGESGADVADEDGGPHFQRDAVGVVAEPEGGVAFQLFVGQEFEGFAVDFPHAHREADGVASVVGFASNDIDFEEVRGAEGADDQGDLVADVEFLAADVQHRGEDVEDRGEIECAVGLGGFAGFEELVDFPAFHAGREIADRGINLFLVVGFHCVEQPRAQRGGVHFRPEICLIGKQRCRRSVAGGGRADDEISRLADIRRCEFDPCGAGVDGAVPAHLQVQHGGREFGERTGGGRSELALPSGRGLKNREGEEWDENQPAANGHAACDGRAQRDIHGDASE